jgi:hypothetical protein
LTIENQTLETPLEQKFEYQPTDENGLPIGGKQVIKYIDPAELPYLLAEQNTLLVRKLREQTRKARLGIDEGAPREDAPRFLQINEFNAKPLSKEQRAQLSRDILDEDTFDQAITTVFESTIGAPAEEFRKTLRDLQQDNNDLKTIREVEVFQSRNPDYVVCDENAQSLVAWMRRYNLAPVAANFQDAYDTLRADGHLVTSLQKVTNATYTPPVQPVAVQDDLLETPDGLREEIPLEDTTPVVIAPVISVTPVAVEEHPALREQSALRPVSRVPVSLSRTSSSGDAAPLPTSIGDQLVYERLDPTTKKVIARYTGQKAIDAMPGDEYKTRMKQKGFLALVDKIEAETKKNRGR